MRKHHESRRTTSARPTRHAVRTAAGIVQARQGQGYTAAEHARALDKLMADILALDRALDGAIDGAIDGDADAGEPGRAAEHIEPKLRLTRRLAAEDIVAPNPASAAESAALRIA